MIPRIEDCKSPIRPTRYNVVVAIETLAKKSPGGIIIPDAHKKREDAASEKGIIVEISPMAFAGADWDLESAKPKIGDVVLFQRYSGKEINPEIDIESDDIKYRVIDDDDIKGIIE